MRQGEIRAAISGGWSRSRRSQTVSHHLLLQERRAAVCVCVHVCTCVCMCVCFMHVHGLIPVVMSFA